MCVWRHLQQHARRTPATDETSQRCPAAAWALGRALAPTAAAIAWLDEAPPPILAALLRRRQVTAGGHLTLPAQRLRREV